MERQRPDRVIGLCCSLFGYSRQAYYQYQKQQEKEAFQEELVVQEVLRHRKLQKKLGGRKLFFMMHSFFVEHGIELGRDAFFDLLRKHGLLVRISKRKVSTTNSRHRFWKHPNLIKGFIPMQPNQLWVSAAVELISLI